MKRIILILICSLVPMIVVSGQEQQAQKLLSEAVYQEEIDGDLNKAIETYQTVIKSYPGERKVVAEAYYHMGMCFEKLGRQDAMNAYREVIRNYADQKDIVVKARGRLAQLEQPVTMAEEPEGLKIRQIWRSPYLDDLGTVSYDGQYRSYVDWGYGDVAVQDLITGEKKKLTDKASLGDTAYFASGTAISKDGKTIASSWWKPHNTTDLVLVDVKNPTMNVIYSKEGEELYPYKWLSNNEIVGLRLIPDQRTIQIFTFNILNKTLTVKKSSNKIYVNQLACSPDEKYIAYDYVSEIDNNTDINLLTANGDNDIPLITNPSNDKVFGWVPGRNEFLFLSDRWGTWDLWAIQLDDGKPIGLPKRIYADIGDVTQVGLTQNGKCYFGFVRRNFSTNIAPFNPEKGVIEIGSGSSLKGSNYGISWSPDGQYMAFIRIEDRNPDNPAQLIVRDLSTGEEHKPANKTFQPMGFRWSPDGKSILTVGVERSQIQTKGYKGGVYLINVQTGQTDKIFLLSDYEYNIPDDDAFPLSRIEWSPDGISFYYLFFKDRLVKHDIETGEDKILFKYPTFSGVILDLSPDGTTLLFGLDYPGDEKSRLFTIPAIGGKEKEICTSQEASRFRTAFWSSEGKYIFFSEVKQSMATSIWRVPATGGTPQKVWSSESLVEIFDLHPEGNQIALSIRERVSELRVIDNLAEELERLDKINK